MLYALVNVKTGELEVDVNGRVFYEKEEVEKDVLYGNAKLGEGYFEMLEVKE